ncbi:hypothetical protein [Metabacillus bambusae]|uniref:Uncharacterized protein n=1 Tax=Metabacillus bambusae TaxID=2795218 RepID=A0ABS3N8I3_9BACI|nr:hypothetical protein [Metabacillus bambusae]MBO1514346.1 hypothetical protein [Metabacillus bambusae]
MRINDIALEIFNKAKKAYKKPVSVHIEGPVQSEKVISTWENKNQIASPGDYIISGIKGEKYPIPATVFNDYEPDFETGVNMYKKKKKIVYVYKVDFKGEVKTAQGEILDFQPGYYIVMESPDKMWAVDGKVFEQSYIII